MLSTRHNVNTAIICNDVFVTKRHALYTDIELSVCGVARLCYYAEHIDSLHTYCIIKVNRFKADFCSHTSMFGCGVWVLVALTLPTLHLHAALTGMEVVLR